MKALQPNYIELQKQERRESMEYKARGMEHVMHHRNAAGYIDFVPQRVDTQVMQEDSLT